MSKGKGSQGVSAGGRSVKPGGGDSEGVLTLDRRSVIIGLVMGVLITIIFYLVGARISKFSLFGLEFTFPSLSSQEAKPIPRVSLVSASYMADDWNPRLVDLRTASTSGIPIHPGESLRFLDLWVDVPLEAGGYEVHAEVFASDGIRLGSTGSQKAVPGLMKLEDLRPESFLHATVTNAWQVQEGWKSFDLRISLWDGSKELSASSYTIRANPRGTSWMIAPPYAHILSLEYAVNGEPPQAMDLARVLESGLPVSTGDTLTLTKVTYKAATDSLGLRIRVEAYLSSGGYDPVTLIASPLFYQETGIAELPDPSQFTWTLPAGKTALVLTVTREDSSTVLDRYVIPFRR